MLTNCVAGPYFFITGKKFFPETNDSLDRIPVSFKVNFDSEENAAQVLAYDWYLNSDRIIGFKDRELNQLIGRGTVKVGVRILSTDGWSGVKSFECRAGGVPVSAVILGRTLLAPGESETYAVQLNFGYGTSVDITSDVVFNQPSPDIGQMNGATFTAATNYESYNPVFHLMATFTDLPALSKDITIVNTGTAEIRGNGLVPSGATTAYTVFAKFLNGVEKEVTNNFNFSSNGGTFIDNQFTAEQLSGNVAEDEVLIRAAKAGSPVVSKKIIVTLGLNQINGSNWLLYGRTAIYRVTNGIGADLSSQYNFSSPVGGFNGNVLTVGKLSKPGDFVITATPKTTGRAVLTKTVQLVTILSGEILGEALIQIGTYHDYSVQVTYSNGILDAITSECVFTASKGTFTGNTYHAPVDTPSSSLVTLTATHSFTGRVFQKVITVQNNHTGIAVIEILDQDGLNLAMVITSPDLTGNGENSDGLVTQAKSENALVVSGDSGRVYTGKNIYPDTGNINDALLLASDLMTVNDVKWRFEINVAKLMIDYPDINTFSVKLLGRAPVPISNLNIRLNNKVFEAKMIMTGSPGTYVPSAIGDPIFTQNSVYAIQGGADGDYESPNLPEVVTFFFFR